MTTISPAVEAHEIPPASILPIAHIKPRLDGLRQALLRRVRGIAWRVLDLETEFQVLD